MRKLPDIDPNALYTAEQAAQFLVEFDPRLTIDEARLEVAAAIAEGKIRISGYLVK